MKILAVAVLLILAQFPAHAEDAHALTPTSFTRECQANPGNSTCELYQTRLKDAEVRSCCEEVAQDPVFIQNYAKDYRGSRQSLFESCVIGMGIVACD